MTTKEVFRLAGLMLAAAAGAVLISGPASAAPAESRTPRPWRPGSPPTRRGRPPMCWPTRR